MGLGLSAYAAPALAYIDPNTGGLIFQLLAPLLAMITGAWLFARDYVKAKWHRLLALMGRKDRREAGSQNGSAAEADARFPR